MFAVAAVVVAAVAAAADAVAAYSVGVSLGAPLLVVAMILVGPPLRFGFRGP